MKGAAALAAGLAFASTRTFEQLADYEPDDYTCVWYASDGINRRIIGYGRSVIVPHDAVGQYIMVGVDNVLQSN